LATSQDSTSHSVGTVLCSDGSLIYDHAFKYLHDATQINQEQILTGAAVLGVTGALFSLDKPIQSMAMRDRSTFNNNLFNITEFYGTASAGLVLSGSVYCSGLLSGDSYIRTTGRMMFESLLWAGVVTTTLKTLVGRSRPYKNEGNLKFRGFQFNDDYLSLPSGHTTVAFAVSSVLAERIHNSVASVGLYSLAGLTGLARVYHNQHWFSDVFLGAAIGTISGIEIVNFGTKEFLHSAARIELMPNKIEFAYSF
jgi:membrane-associated phospholipid phosphatase